MRPKYSKDTIFKGVFESSDSTKFEQICAKFGQLGTQRFRVNLVLLTNVAAFYGFAGPDGEWNERPSPPTYRFETPSKSLTTYLPNLIFLIPIEAQTSGEAVLSTQ
jgi:hypothetical protein